MVEVRRKESESGKFTLVFLAAPQDESKARETMAPLLELTYNWPDENGNTETYSGGRNFGHLAYRVENIYATCQHLMDQGITINRPPRDGYMAFIKSPDGISIELLQKGDPLQPQETLAKYDEYRQLVNRKPFLFRKHPSDFRKDLWAYAFC